MPRKTTSSCFQYLKHTKILNISKSDLSGAWDCTLMIWSLWFIELSGKLKPQKRDDQKECRNVFKPTVLVKAKHWTVLVTEFLYMTYTTMLLTVSQQFSIYFQLRSIRTKVEEARSSLQASHSRLVFNMSTNYLPNDSINILDFSASR